MGRRVLIVVDAAVIGGVTRIVANLARGLRARDWDVRTVFPAWADSEFMAFCESMQLRPELSPALGALSSGGPISAVISQLALRRYLAGTSADVVNFHYSGSIVSPKDVLAARMARVAGCVASVHLAARWDEQRPLRRTMTGLAARLADRVVCESHAAAQGQYEAGASPHKVTVVPNGVRAPDNPLTRAQARQQFGLEPGQFVVGAVARLAPVKRLQDLIETVGILRESNIPVSALIAGDGPDRGSLERLAADRAPGIIRFLGHADDPSPVYAACDAIVLPSELEGHPLTAIEAAFLGKPCVATAIGGTSEIVIDGVTGFLVPVGAPGVIAERLTRLFGDPSLVAQMGSAAFARASTEFTVEAMVSGYERVFTEVGTRKR